MKVNICGVEIDNLNFSQVVEKIVQAAKAPEGSTYVVTPNAHHVVMLQKNAHFREIYQNAFLVVPDGVSLLWASKILGTPLQGRVNGTDLFEELSAVAAKENLNVFLLGGRPGAAESAARTLQVRHPTLSIVGFYCPPYGFESDAIELEQINAMIQAAAPHLLFVGLGAPKQEYWMHSTYQTLGVPVSLGIGVSFELVAGIVQRAPKMMQQTGLEWVFRLIAEPKRLWQRYLVGNTVFIWLVIKQKLGLFRLQ
ncbi:MAG: WecB/TagA/CpsF family glycosyltransferase [Leptolyngbyaceae cyanobacterium SL_7_1]|nr:WecB/TagA/CpsF family glycosyltransferase [Leptolyngbyaceae cyanobacterium SL_7_1]